MSLTSLQIFPTKLKAANIAYDQWFYHDPWNPPRINSINLFEEVRKRILEKVEKDRLHICSIFENFFENFISGKSQHTLENAFWCTKCRYCSNVGADFNLMVQHLKTSRKCKCKSSDVRLLHS